MSKKKKSDKVETMWVEYVLASKADKPEDIKAGHSWFWEGDFDTLDEAIAASKEKDMHGVTSRITCVTTVTLCIQTG